MALNTTVLSAAQAYSDAKRTAKVPGIDTAIGQNTPAVGGDFGSMLRDTVQNAADVQRTAEKMSMKAVANEADLQQVIGAIANAELTLNTVIAVRDRVVQAYQEILRMPI